MSCVGWQGANLGACIGGQHWDRKQTYVQHGVANAPLHTVTSQATACGTGGACTGTAAMHLALVLNMVHRAHHIHTQAGRPSRHACDAGPPPPCKHTATRAQTLDATGRRRHIGTQRAMEITSTPEWCHRSHARHQPDSKLALPKSSQSRLSAEITYAQRHCTATTPKGAGSTHHQQAFHANLEHTIGCINCPSTVQHNQNRQACSHTVQSQ